MRYNLIFTITAIFIISCNSNENAELSKLNKEKEELVKQIDGFNQKLRAVNEKINAIQKTDNSTTISTYTIAYQPFEHTIDIQSNVSTDMDVMIMPEYAGTLTWRVREGSHVGKGQVIGSINDGGLSQQLSSAKIQADLAKTAFEKQQRLWNQQIGSEIQYLQAKTQSEAAQKQISALQAQLSRTSVKAPFSGTIDQLIMQSGQSVAPGMPIAKIINLGDMKITADVSEKYIAQVKVGTLVNIELPDLNQTIQSRVSRVSNYINPNNRSFSIEIPVSNKGGMMKPNLSAKIKIINYKNSNAIVVPSSSIKLNAENKPFVYTLTNINGKKGTATKTYITTGNTSADFTEVLSGLKPSDIIIREGGNQVVEGAKVIF